MSAEADLRAKLQSYIPHPCPICDGSGDIYNPEYVKWNDRHGAEWDALARDPEVADVDAEMRRRHPDDPEPWDCRGCSNCDGRGTTSRLDIRAEDLLAVLDIVDDGLRRAFNTIYSATGEGA